MSKDALAPHQDNLSEWSNMSTCGLLFQWDSTIKIQLSILVYCKVNIIIWLNLSCSHYVIAKQNCSVCIIQQSLTHSLYFNGNILINIIHNLVYFSMIITMLVHLLQMKWHLPTWMTTSTRISWKTCWRHLDR